MLRNVLLSSTLLLTAAPSAAQYYVGAYRMTPQEATVISDYWIRSYLRRPPVQGEESAWAQRLQREPAVTTLAAMLSTPEYFNFAGGTPHAYLHRLIEDVGHRQPSPYEVEARFQQTAGWSAHSIAMLYLREHPSNWWPGPAATPPPELQYFYRRPISGYPPYGNLRH